jgi:hypothetical protein
MSIVIPADWIAAIGYHDFVLNHELEDLATVPPEGDPEIMCNPIFKS